MRFASHRKDIENRFKERFKRDRARTTVLPISQFGILELTRQRMRGSQESLHFAECPSCRGRGLLQRPESVAARALRQLADVLDREKVSRAELVVSPRVAGALLSQCRAAITRLELTSGKHMDVRVSETLPPDRVAIYAYDEKGADIDVDRLPKRRKKPEVVEWEDMDLAKQDDTWAADMKQEAEEASSVHATAELALARAEEDGLEFEFLSDDDEDDAPAKKKRRRRRGGRRRRKSSDEPQTDAQSDDAHNTETQSADRQNAETQGTGTQNADDTPPGDASHAESSEHNDAPPKKKRRRRRGGRGRGRSADTEHDDSPTEPSASPDEPHDQATDDDPDAAPKKKRRRRRSRKKTASDNGQAESAEREPKSERKSETKSESKPEPAAEPKPQPRTLYGRGRRKLSASELSKIAKDD